MRTLLDRYPETTALLKLVAHNTYKVPEDEVITFFAYVAAATVSWYLSVNDSSLSNTIDEVDLPAFLPIDFIYKSFELLYHDLSMWALDNIADFDSSVAELYSNIAWDTLNSLVSKRRGIGNRIRRLGYGDNNFSLLIDPEKLVVREITDLEPEDKKHSYDTYSEKMKLRKRRSQYNERLISIEPEVRHLIYVLDKDRMSWQKT